MSTTVMILICILLAAVLVIAILWLRNKDLNLDLDFVAGERDKWEQRARERGWRFPMEQAVCELQESTDALSAVARGLADQTVGVRRNTEACRNLEKQAKSALELTRAANDNFDKAVQSLNGLREKLPPKAAKSATVIGPVQPEIMLRLVRDTIRRVEASGGQIEPDPKKRN